ncbi:phage tail terminator protein [Chromohalobacter israelensis]|uniref:phage tail terminator protein n=1 Tax=Chromohalobacter israelensis TaxID=141390 RepID=UPI00265BAB22|nr:hypothetical protein [Chromohalobacter salexigens]MDO0944657.1 hypothetical protein [Chromohalobacter salexigens]
MLSLDPWLERLETANLPAPVELAANLKAAQETRRVPGVLLVPGRDRVTHQARIPNPHHKVTTEVMLVTAVKRHGSARMGRGKDHLSELRGPVLTALVHWTPPGAEIAIRWNGGQLLTLNDHALFWADVLATDYWWKETTP